MRSKLFERGYAGLALNVLSLTLIASMTLPQALRKRASAPPVPVVQDTSSPVNCLGTLFALRANTLRFGGGPKLVVSLDVTRADRCAGRFGQPVGRLHGFLVLAPDRLAVRTHLRTALQSPWLALCRWVRAECLDTNAVIRWIPAQDGAR